MTASELAPFAATHTVARRDLAAKFEAVTRQTFGELVALVGIGNVTRAAVGHSVPALRMHAALERVLVEQRGQLVIDIGKLEDAADRFAEVTVERGGWKVLGKLTGSMIMQVSAWEYGEYTTLALFSPPGVWVDVIQRIEIGRDEHLTVTAKFAHQLKILGRTVTEYQLRMRLAER